LTGSEGDQVLRDMAKARGFKLAKSRRRKPGGDFGKFGLTDAKTGKACFGVGARGLEASAKDIEAFLRTQTQADWKSSISAPEPKAKAPPPKRKPAPERPARAQPKPRQANPVPVLRPESPPKPKPEPKLVIREAAARDVRAIAELIEGDAPDPRRIASTMRALAKDGTPVLVADRGGIVGAVSYDPVRLLHHAGPIGRIGFLATAATARRQGIGTALLAEAERRLRKLGCESFELVTLIELSNANSFLRRHGYQRDGYRFTRGAEKK
jgi:ribosomal protein S18 acetylase RimI-like enzyme